MLIALTKFFSYGLRGFCLAGLVLSLTVQAPAQEEGPKAPPTKKQLNGPKTKKMLVPPPPPQTVKEESCPDHPAKSLQMRRDTDTMGGQEIRNKKEEGDK